MSICLSIIIPVYNAEEYILDTLGSLIEKSDRSTEIVIVDDGSSDNSFAVIEAYLNKINGACQSKVIFVSQDNLGVSAARNHGIEIATGRYIGFLDSDDLVYNRYLLEIYSIINRYEPDIIEFGYSNFDKVEDLKHSVPKFCYDKFGFHKTSEVIENIYAASIFYSCLRVIKREVIDTHRFPIGIKFCEDMMFLSSVYPNCETVYHLNKSLIGYRNNEFGATQNVSPDYIENLIKFYSSIDTVDMSSKLLKANIFYAIYSCSLGLNGNIKLPLRIWFDTKTLFISVMLEKKLTLKKKIILALPSLCMKARKLQNPK